MSRSVVHRGLVALVFLIGSILPTFGQTGPGTWKVETQLLGSTSGTTATTGNAVAQIVPNNGAIALDLRADASGIVKNTPPSAQILPFTASAQNQTASGVYRITLTWQPKNNDWVHDPPPAKQWLQFNRTANVEVSAAAGDALGGATAHADASATATWSDPVVMATKSANADAPQDSNTGLLTKSDVDKEWVVKKIDIINGTGSLDIPFSITVSAHANGTLPTGGGGGVGGIESAKGKRKSPVPAQKSKSSRGSTTDFTQGNGATAAASAHAWLTIDFKLMGRDLGRGNGLLSQLLEGIQRTFASDPSYTRWLPLSFSPMISPQPFRKADGFLRQPWGNIYCDWAIRMEVDRNPDVNHAPNYYEAPSISGNYRLSTKREKPGYVILDANGDRLTFDENLIPDSDIRSTFTQIYGSGGGAAIACKLSNAGPPGHLRERGDYTYTFEAPPEIPTNPTFTPDPARLTRIDDAFGNSQLAVYNSADGYLVVTDTTSNRRLIFQTQGGYIYQVIAPVLFGTTPYLRTSLNFDGTGHLTVLNAYSGTSAIPTTTQQWTYGSAVSPDAVTQLNQNGSTIRYTYFGSPGKDYSGRAVPRLATVTPGDSNDFSSSDSGGPVGGTTTYSYGTVTLGYGYYGVDTRTNSVTDPRGNKTSIIYYYATPEVLTDDGLIAGYDITAPTYTGTTLPNFTSIRYSPDMSHPTAITQIDPLSRTFTQYVDSSNGNIYRLFLPGPGSGNRIWNFTWGGASNLTSVTDPTNVLWNFEYTPTGGHLTAVKDAAGQV